MACHTKKTASFNVCIQHYNSSQKWTQYPAIRRNVLKNKQMVLLLAKKTHPHQNN